MVLYSPNSISKPARDSFFLTDGLFEIRLTSGANTKSTPDQWHEHLPAFAQAPSMHLHLERIAQSELWKLGEF